jgi:hypothetical protein
MEDQEAKARTSAMDRAREAGFELSKLQRKIGCEFCRFFNLEAAFGKRLYCLWPVAFDEKTIEAFVGAEDVRFRCHKFERIEGLNGSEAPILDNGRRKVASPVNTGVSYD